MKDIYLNMNNQNILKYYGTRLDAKLDSSEYYDHEISKVVDDYNSDVLDLNTPITYSGLTINTSFTGFACSKNRITLTEYDNRPNNNSYIYSGLTMSISYSTFVSQFGSNYENTILNNDVFNYTGFTNESHYFRITAYNGALLIPVSLSGLTEAQIVTGFSQTILACTRKLQSSNNCCPQSPQLSVKPWAFKFDTGSGNTLCDPIIKRRTETGWSLDFIFNRNYLPWTSGGIFYYLGVRGENDLEDYADNNLSFGFTSDGKIKWTAVHYSGICNTVSGYSESYYVASGVTPTLCTTSSSKDFNVSIVFDRNNYYDPCDIENRGGWNDLIRGPHPIEYQDTVVTAVTSTQIATGYLIKNSADVVMSGATESYEYIEELNKNWADEKANRLGTLKIYLNGRPIYKLKNWEEVIPSSRGVQPFIQSFGGGTGLMNSLHSGTCCFIMKSVKYYEESLDYVHVRHNFLTRLNSYNFEICGSPCADDLERLPTQTPTPTYTRTPTPTPTPTITPTRTLTPTITPTITTT